MNVIVTVPDEPLQIVPPPLITAVGLGFTFTVADPVRSPALEVQLASDKDETVYVVVEEGETVIVAGLLLVVPEVIPSLKA